jgi:hypothetical protein
MELNELAQTITTSHQKQIQKPQLAVSETRATKLVDAMKARIFTKRKELICHRCSRVISDPYVLSRYKRRKGRIRCVNSEETDPAVYYHKQCWEGLFH